MSSFPNTARPSKVSATIFQYPGLIQANSIKVLELQLGLAPRVEKCSVTDQLLAQHFPNLHTLILNDSRVTDDLIVSRFWDNHRNLERIELGTSLSGEWFPHVSSGVLPNLKCLAVSKCSSLL